MPRYVVERIVTLLNQRKIPINGARILVLGVAYKRDIDDTRESPALSIIEQLLRLEGVVSYHDPFVPKLDANGFDLDSVELTSDALSQQDLVVVISDHTCLDWDFVAEHAKLVLDTRNGMGDRGNDGKVIKL
jgi:UDP-N-acetyl-D-glucosamine dehydrogenase